MLQCVGRMHFAGAAVAQGSCHRVGALAVHACPRPNARFPAARMGRRACMQALGAVLGAKSHKSRPELQRPKAPHHSKPCPRPNSARQVSGWGRDH